ncbi:MAG: hypothetical protein AAF963_03335 [Bacteroidota bacterium]
MSRFFLLTLCLAIAVPAWGQPPRKGTLKDTEFVIEKERKNLLQEAARLFKSAPAAPRVATPVQPLFVTPPTIHPTFDTLPRKIQLLRAKQDVLTQLYSNYLQGGHGNFYAPYLEVFLANRRDPRYAYGLHFKHQSAGQTGYFEENHHLIQLHGKRFIESLWAGGGALCYRRDSYPLYKPASTNGAALEKQSIVQFTIHPTLTNYTEGPLNYQFDPSFHYVATDKAQEIQGGIQGSGEYTLSDDFTFKAITDLHFTKYNSTPRHLYRFKPMLVFEVHRFDIQFSPNFVYQNDVSAEENSFKVYPVLEVKYPLHPWLRPYGGISGDVQRNSLQSLLKENPRLAATPTLRHTNQPWLLYGGVRGDVMEQISFNTGLSAGKYQNLHCLVNSTDEPGRFDVCYDPAAQLYNIFGELTHSNQADTWTTRLRGDYFHYNLQKLPQPWHRPRYQLDLLSTYRWQDKVILKGSVCCIGGIKAREGSTAKALPTVFDASIRIDYLWNSRLSIFLDCQNLLVKCNERYLHYPSRGFQFVGGLTYAW